MKTKILIDDSFNFFKNDSHFKWSKDTNKDNYANKSTNDEKVTNLYMESTPSKYNAFIGDTENKDLNNSMDILNTHSKYM